MAGGKEFCFCNSNRKMEASEDHICKPLEMIYCDLANGNLTITYLLYSLDPVSISDKISYRILKRDLIIRSHEASEPRDWQLKWSHSFEI